jgi:hypothetical protein
MDAKPQQILVLYTPNGRVRNSIIEQMFAKLHEAKPEWDVRLIDPADLPRFEESFQQLPVIRNEDIMMNFESEFSSEEARGERLMKCDPEPCETGARKHKPALSPLLKALLNRAIPPRTVNTMFGPYQVPVIE